VAKTGTFLSVADDQEGAAPVIVTPTRPLPADSFGLQIARGLVPGAAPFGAFGERSATAGDSNRVIWPNGVYSIPDSAGVQMSLVSDDTADDDGDTGINSVHVHYLDANLDPQVEAVTLNGTTPVTTAATDIRFIQCMHGHTYGSGKAAAGTITASNGGTTYAQITAGGVRCEASTRMVPRGKVAYVAGATASATSGTSAARVIVRLCASEFIENQYTDPFVLIPYGSIGIQDNSEAFTFPVPLGPFSAGTVIGMTHTNDKDADVNGSWYGWTENA
jgi:hypothetical protein